MVHNFHVYLSIHPINIEKRHLLPPTRNQLFHHLIFISSRIIHILHLFLFSSLTPRSFPFPLPLPRRAPRPCTLVFLPLVVIFIFFLTAACHALLGLFLRNNCMLCIRDVGMSYRIEVAWCCWSICRSASERFRHCLGCILVEYSSSGWVDEEGRRVRAWGQDETPFLQVIEGALDLLIEIEET